MPLKTLNQLQSISGIGRVIEKITVNPANENTFARLERVINAINSLAQTYLQAQGKNVTPTSVIESPAPSGNLALPPGKITAPNDSPKREGNPMINELLKTLEKHLQSCAKENSEMLIGEALNKLPLTVSQFLNLLELYKLTKSL